MRGLFVTGTDTGVGKTAVALALLMLFRRRGYRTVAMKPVAAGCETTPAGLRNDDARLLRAAATVALPYGDVNPFALAPAVAPHIAAAEAGTVLTLGALLGAWNALPLGEVDAVVVEGAGGWLVPLLGADTLADFAAAVRLPVLLVVGLRLGCLNHALLTAESIRARGVRLAGWVGNQIEPDMERRDQNVATLAQRLGVPCLGLIPVLPEPTPGAVLAHLEPDPIISALGAG